jgi:hypothetical protein
MQCLGQMVDATLQQLLRDRGHPTMEASTESQSGAVKKFKDQ